VRAIGSERARTVFLFPTEELRPVRGIVLADVVKSIVERYSFLPSSDLPDYDLSKGLSFKLGSFSVKDGMAAINDFTIFNDGLLCEANTTFYAEAFLYDFLIWSNNELKLGMPQSKIRILYYSNLVVEFDFDVIASLLGKDVVFGLLKKEINDTYNFDPNLYSTKIAFGQDKTEIPEKYLYGDFTIERRVGASFETNRFYSTAPISTARHFALLEELGKQLA
jgi:hypothetical protein